MSLCINVNVCVYGVDGDAKRCKMRVLRLEEEMRRGLEWRNWCEQRHGGGKEQHVFMEQGALHLNWS